MIRINVICEGQTEEAFVKELLYHELIQVGRLLNPINLKRGNSYQKYRRNVVITMKSDPTAYVTSMIDLYGMSEEFPGYANSKHLQPYAKAAAIEEAILADIAAELEDSHRFIPYVQLHEFEALLFSDAAQLEEALSMDHEFPRGAFMKIRSQYSSPEHINDNRLTAPSKRILNQVPFYSKTVDGIYMALDIGIRKIRQECIHFDQWVNRLSSLPQLHA